MSSNSKTTAISANSAPSAISIALSLRNTGSSYLLKSVLSSHGRIIATYSETNKPSNKDKLILHERLLPCTHASAIRCDTEEQVLSPPSPFLFLYSTNRIQS